MVSYLQVENLTKSFGDLVLFEDLSFGVAEGQRIGLIAKNGTGKPPCSISWPVKKGMMRGKSLIAATCAWAIWNSIRIIRRT